MRPRDLLTGIFICAIMLPGLGTILTVFGLISCSSRRPGTVRPTSPV